MPDENDAMREVFGDVIFSYTRAQAIQDGVLIDVSEMARQAGIRFPTALTSAVWGDYVEVDEELRGHQDVKGRLWDILWMLAMAIRTQRITGDQGTFEVIIAKPDRGDWQPNEKIHEGNRGQRLVTLKAICGPSDDASPCLTVMRSEED